MMARKKIKLAWIVDDASRKATYRKRSKGLVKKVSELSTLCGVEAAMVVTGTYKQLPDVWPPFHAETTLLKFKKLPEMDKGKQMINQERFFRQRTEKLKEQARKLASSNRESEMDIIMYKCLSGSDLEGVDGSDLDVLAAAVDAKAKKVQERFYAVKNMDWLSIKQPLEVKEKERGSGSCAEGDASTGQ